MIAHLSGTLADFGPDWAVIDAGGVGSKMALAVLSALSVDELQRACAAGAVAAALDELGEGAALNDLVRVTLKRAAG